MGKEQEMLKRCPFCGSMPDSNNAYAWCWGTKDHPHAMVQVERAAWNRRSSDEQAEVVVAADKLVSEIEQRFPNWKAFRDLVDCIDCTLHALRGGAPAVAAGGVTEALRNTAKAVLAALAVGDEGIREGWQDIETAPKDGTEVLLWGVCWRDHQAYAPDRNVGWWAGDHLGWQTRGQDEDIDPTHWRPLPTPPSRGEGV